MNRIDRISAILIQLQSRRIVKAADIAERFEISLRTVYRDIRTLEEAGVPIIGEAGVGYSIMDGYRLPPVMFTREEATALVTAEKLVEKLTDPANGASYKSALFKIRSVLRATEKEYLETIDEHIEVLQSRRQPQQSNLSLLQPILKAIAEKKVVTLQYFAQYKQENSTRYIEPIGVFFLQAHWHLIAFCHLRNDYRDFRLDRVRTLQVTDTPYTRQHPPLKEYINRECDNKETHMVVVRVNQRAAAMLGEEKYYHGFISQAKKGEEVEMTFLSSSLEGFARWFLMFADCATVLEPEALITRIAGLVETISCRLPAPNPTSQA